MPPTMMQSFSQGSAFAKRSMSGFLILMGGYVGVALLGWTALRTMHLPAGLGILFKQGAKDPAFLQQKREASLALAGWMRHGWPAMALLVAIGLIAMTWLRAGYLGALARVARGEEYDFRCFSRDATENFPHFIFCAGLIFALYILYIVGFLIGLMVLMRLIAFLPPPLRHLIRTIASLGLSLIHI